MKKLVLLLIFTTWGEVNSQSIENITFPKNPLDSITSYLLENPNLKGFYPTIFPFNNSFEISSDYGFRMHPINGIKTFHNGIDFKCPNGTKVIAPAHGRIVLVVENDPVIGNSITISHLNNWQTSYSHLDSIKVKANDIVSKYSVIGTTGASGQVTGHHLHFTITYKKKKLDPLPYCYLDKFITSHSSIEKAPENTLTKTKVN